MEMRRACKFNASTLIILTFLLINPSTQECTEGCVACHGDSCFICEGRHVFGGKCSQTTAPQSENCLLYYLADECRICQRGWAADPRDSFRCTLPHKIRNCVSAVGDFFNPSHITCSICQGGYPNPSDRKSCTRFMHGLHSSLSNCLYGGIDLYSNEPYCVRCRYGFAAGKEGCVRTGVEGCWQFDDRSLRCSTCDPWMGYHMIKSDFTCTRVRW